MKKKIHRKFDALTNHCRRRYRRRHHQSHPLHNTNTMHIDIFCVVQCEKIPSNLVRDIVAVLILQLALIRPVELEIGVVTEIR